MKNILFSLFQGVSGELVDLITLKDNKKCLTSFLFSLLIVCCSALSAGAAPVQWSVADGGNGHYYEAVAVNDYIEWNDAKSLAEASGGYLATSTSSLENEFIYSLIAGSEFWDFSGNSQGPFLGGYLNTTTFQWEWVTGEVWAYTNWHLVQPDNGGTFQDYQYGVYEPYLAFWGQGINNPTSYWNDIGVGQTKAYIIEYDFNPVPEPASIILFISGLASLLVLNIKSRKNK